MVGFRKPQGATTIVMDLYPSDLVHVDNRGGFIDSERDKIHQVPLKFVIDLRQSSAFSRKIFLVMPLTRILASDNPPADSNYERKLSNGPEHLSTGVVYRLP